MGLTRIPEGYFIRFDRPNSSPINSVLNHHVLSFLPSLLPSLLNAYAVAVSSLLVDIFDLPPAKPGVESTVMDTS